MGLLIHRSPSRRTVGTSSSPPLCARLRTRLKLGRVPYTAVNIHQDRDAAAVVRAHDGGDELVPTVRLDGDRWLSNPTYRQLRAAMGA